MADRAGTLHHLLSRLLNVPAPQRAAWLARELPDEPNLRQLLIAAVDDPNQFDGVEGRSDLPIELHLDSPLPPPSKISRYEIIRPLGAGGMGEVFLARDPTVDRCVAVKLLYRNFDTDELRRRFLHETRAAGQLQHPAIAHIYDAGITLVHSAELPFIAMEVVNGRPLDQYVAEELLPLRRRLQLVIDVAEAIHYAHAKGVVHCDLKPDNILVDDTGMVKVLDFGVSLTAKSLPEDARTYLGGTVGYMSPEQADGDPALVDRRADVYALGVIAYELVNGDPVIVQREIAMAHAHGEPSLIGMKQLPTILRWDLEKVLLKALRYNPAKRYSSARALGDDFRRVLDARPIAADDQPAWTAALCWSIRTDRIRQAAAVCPMYALVAAFDLFWSMVILSRILIDVTPVVFSSPDGLFVFHTGKDGLLLGLMAYLSWRIGRNEVLPVIGAVVGSAALSTFCWMVAIGQINYDMGGNFSRPEQSVLYGVVAPLASLGLLLNCFALVAVYRLRAWNQSPKWRGEQDRPSVTARRLGTAATSAPTGPAMVQRLARDRQV